MLIAQGICVTVAHRTLTPFAGVRIPHPLPEKDRHLSTDKCRSFSTKCSACAERYVCFASEVSCGREVPAGVGGGTLNFTFAEGKNFTA